MEEIDYKEALKGLLNDLRNITIQAMASSGVDSNSDLAKSVKYYMTADGIQMEVAVYYPFVDAGHVVKRRAMARKIPLDVLIKWIKAKHLVPRNSKSGRFITTNQFAYAIQNSIYKKGISGKIKTKGKNYGDTVATDVEV